MLSRATILVSLSRSSLRVGVLANGVVARAERVMLDAEAFEDAWSKGLKPLDEPLRRALITLKVRAGAQAYVTYQSPRSFADVFIAPAEGAASDAAADLYLKQSLPAGGVGWVSSVVPVDAQLRSDEGKPPRRMSVIVADTAIHADTLAGWLRRADVEPAGLLPTSGAILLSELSREPAQDATPRARVFMTEHVMSLCAWAGEQVAFARCADVGYSTIIEAVLRGAKGAARTPGTAQPTREYATRLLFTAGVPGRDQVLDPATNLHAEHVLPLMQPAVQRCVIELRQTIRFGMREGELPEVRMCGPGAGIPGLCELISSQMEIDVGREDNAPGMGIAEDQSGDLNVGASIRSTGAWMQAPSERARTEQRVLGRAVGAGAVVAAIALGALWSWHRSDTAKHKVETTRLRPAVEVIESARSARAEARRLAGDARAGQELVQNGLGTKLPWGGALAAISACVGPDVQLAEVAGDYPADASDMAVVTLRGSARVSTSASDESIAAFLGRLSKLQIVENAKIVSARSAKGNDQFREFVISVRLRGIPATSAQTIVAQGEEVR